MSLGKSQCQNPLQCAVVHEVKAEMTQMNSKLGEINFAIRSIFQVLNGLGLNPVTSEITSQYSVIPTYTTDIVQENDEIITNDNVKKEPIESGQYYFGYEETISGQNINETEQNLINDSNIANSNSVIAIEKELSDSCQGQSHSDFDESSSEPKTKVSKPSCSYTSTPYQLSYASRRKKIKKKERIRRQERKVYCASCQIWVWRASWFRHVACKHFSEPALICGECGYTVKWQLEHMTKHFRMSHPNKPWNINDRRDELKEEIQKTSKELLDMVAGSEPVRRDIVNVTPTDNVLLNC